MSNARNAAVGLSFSKTKSPETAMPAKQPLKVIAKISAAANGVPRIRYIQEAIVPNSNVQRRDFTGTIFKASEVRRVYFNKPWSLA